MSGSVKSLARLFGTDPMVRFSASATIGVPSLTLIALIACTEAPPPDEEQFRQDVVQMVVEGAKRTLGTGEADYTTRTIVFDTDSIPPTLRDVEVEIKRGLETAGIAWLDADLGGDPDNLPGEWTTFGLDTTLRFNKTHSVVHVVVHGSGRQREVEWSYVCGPVCGYGRRVRVDWSGGT